MRAPGSREAVLRPPSSNVAEPASRQGCVSFSPQGRRFERRRTMTDIPNSLPDHHGSTLLAAPDTEVDAREVFGVDIDMKVPAFNEADDRVPDLDPAHVFDADPPLAILAGVKLNHRLIAQGYPGPAQPAPTPH